MLLTEKAIAEVEINDYKFNFKFDFKVIENLHYALSDEIIRKRLSIKEVITPLDLLEKFGEGYNESYLILILHAICDGFHSLDEIEDVLLKVDIADKESIYLIFKSIIVQSLIFIQKQDQEQNNKSSKNESDNKEEVDFEDWFNYYYTMAIDKLKISLQEFYNSTPAQLKERVYRVNIDKKNTYILAYCEVMKARSENSEVDEVEEATSMYDFMDKTK